MNSYFSDIPTAGNDGYVAPAPSIELHITQDLPVKLFYAALPRAAQVLAAEHADTMLLPERHSNGIPRGIRELQPWTDMRLVEIIGTRDSLHPIPPAPVPIVTTSEVVLRRIQRRIRDGDVPNHSVRLWLYALTEDGAVDVSRLEFQTDGELPIEIFTWRKEETDA